MGPKKGKDPAADENYWRTCIEDAQLNDDNWKVKVVIIEAAGGDQDRMYLNKFEIFAAEERRFVIKNICKTETIFMINQLGGEKKVKDDNLRVFEEGQAFLKDKKDIPSDIQALIIKHLIMKMKEEYLFIKKQRLEVKEGLKRESMTMIDRAEVRGTVSVKPEPPPEPPPVKGKGKKEAEPEEPEPAEGKKYNTVLRVRGEEWRDKVYVDDFPTDGPNIYVAITGFVEPYLPISLVKIGIPLTAIVQVRINPIVTKVPSTLLTATKRGQSQLELLTEKSMIFWDDLQQLRINKDTADEFKNTAFVVFSPPYWDTERLSGNSDAIYDELCYVMYDVQDLTRQHFHYLDNIDIINIPEETGDERYNKYYHNMIDELPLESVTIYSVLDSILQTVAKSEQLDEESSKSSLSTAMTNKKSSRGTDVDEKVCRAENLVKEIFNTLCITDTNKKFYRITYGEEYENHRDPIIINYGDFAKNTTFHLGNINLDNIVWSTLYGMPINNLWKYQPRPTDELEAKMNFHVNLLLSCFDRTDIETAELNRLLNILACRKLYNNRSSLKRQHLMPTTISDFKRVYLKRSVLAEPLPTNSCLFRSSSVTSPSFPSITKNNNDSSYISGSSDNETCRIKFLFDCPNISELVSAAEIANSKPIDHMIDDFDFFEDFSGVSALQIMLDAFNKFNCVDYKYCEVTDRLILMFYNSHDKEGIAREEWRCHLATPLCLQDFFDFVLEEHYDWIQNEEKIYDEEMALKLQTEYNDQCDPIASKSCIENTEVDMELLIEGSLKFQEIQEQLMVEHLSPEVSTKNLSSKKTTLSPSTDADSKSSRKTKSPMTSTPNRRASLFSKSRVVSTVEIPKKPFSGYDLGDRRVEVFGKDATFFSKDGTKVFSFYVLSIPMNTEYIILNVVPGKGSNEFWFHKALGACVTTEILDICESFRINTKDNVMINIKKQTYQVPLPTIAITSFENSKQKDNLSQLSNHCIQMFETKSFHSLFLTWPNGLITETVYEINSPNISHVKQYYINPVSHLNEEMRFVSLNGEVIIFRPSGNIEVLRPDSSYITIKKYDKRIVLPEVPIEVPSEASSDKSKKGKGKEKPKEKISKTSSKSSKNVFTDEDKISNVKPPEYELHIEEFEFIETNGLRTNWINDIPYDIEKLLIRTATDFNLREVFSRRMDGTNILINKDGIQIVTFPNNTRIISTYVIEHEEIYPEWTEDEKEYFDMIDSITTETTKSKNSISHMSQKSTYSASVSSSTSRRVEEEELNEKPRTDGYVSVQISYTIEHENFSTITVNKEKKNIVIDSPNGTSITVDENNYYEMVLDDFTSAEFDGENLMVNYEACPECQSNTTCKVKIKPTDKSSVSKIHRNWLKMKDSFSKVITVNEEGNINFVSERDCSVTSKHNTEESVIVDETGDKSIKAEEKVSDYKSEASVVSHGKCREMYLAKTIKFFVLKRDLTCAELIHRALLEDYRRACCWQPWCSISNYDTFGDYRSMMSILMPVHLTETEKWLVDSKLANKPKYLTYKDLKKDPGKGWYHWMRPYERFVPVPMKPDNALPPRLPRAFVLRTLEQQWKEKERETLKGAKELLAAILKYRQILESDSDTCLNVSIVDNRSEDQRQIDDIIQAIAHRLYEDLKLRLEIDVQTRAKAAITTKPPQIEQTAVEGEMEEESEDEQKALEEERQSAVKEIEVVDEMSPNLRRYWRRRAEEFKEEQFYKYLLREGSVPPYFRNLLGGAIWWDMNDTAGDAVLKAERKKMKCVCAEEATPRTAESKEPYM